MTKVKKFFRKALFADLDGTIIKTKSGNNLPVDKDDWELRPNIISAIKSYGPEYLFIVTNQGGIERGIITQADFEEKLERIIALLRSLFRDEITVKAYYCQYNNSSNPFRKPNTGMIDFFKEKYDVKNYQSMMIGDASGKPGDFSDSDRKCAENAGIMYLDVEDFEKKYSTIYIK